MSLREETGGIRAFRLDGQGGGQEVDWTGVAESVDRRILWIHLDLQDPRCEDWLQRESNIPPWAVEALLAEDVRPRVLPTPEGLLVLLRGINTNPGADPWDMVSIRVWIEPTRIVSARRRRLKATEDLRVQLAAGSGPRRPGELLVQLADKMTERTIPVVTALEDVIDELEEQSLEGRTGEIRTRLSHARRQAIGLRRYLSPQREALARLCVEPTDLLHADDRMALHEVGNGVQRFVEALDAARERAAVLHEEVGHFLAEETSRTVYLLSIVTAVFLPLGLVTGLLGVNVGGIPGAEEPLGFVAVVLLLVVLAAGQIWLLRRKNLL